MTIAHHPIDSTLASYAAGTLDQGRHVAIATHLVACRACRAFVRSVEEIGGTLLAGLAPAPMARGALAAVEARLNEPRSGAAAEIAPAVPAKEIPGLPDFVRRYRFGDWRRVAPFVHMRPIELPNAGRTRLFLLRSAPGTKMLAHTHTGLEMTCVLTGAFQQDGNRFGAGDFDHGDATIDHRPVVEEREACICLVAMQGDLRFKGLIGRLAQPFVRL